MRGKAGLCPAPAHRRKKAPSGRLLRRGRKGYFKKRVWKAGLASSVLPTNHNHCGVGFAVFLEYTGMVVSSFFLGVFDTSIITRPRRSCNGHSRRFWGNSRRKKAPGEVDLLGGLAFWGDSLGEGLQGCCLGQARLRTTSQSHSVRQLP